MDRISALWKRLPNTVQAILIQSEMNRMYFTGLHSSAGTVLLFRDASYLIIDFRYIETARATVKTCEVIEQKDIMVQLRQLLQKHNVRTLSIESMELKVSDLTRFRDKLQDVCTIDYSDTVSKAIFACRTIKSADEIACMQKAQDIAERGLAETLNFIRPGISEREIMLYLNGKMLEYGSEGESFPTIALTGAATSMPHGVPQADRIVKNGDFVLMDFGAMYNGYHSDMTRTVAVGEPTEKMRQVYDIVLQAQLKAMDAIKPGITGKEYDQVARDYITDAGYGEMFGHSLGHGVGLDIHEYPVGGPLGKAKLEVGNVITDEPGIYLPGEFGVRIEDFVVVTEDGCKNLTHAPKALQILG